ncbi:MAG: hypothetical protein HYY87_01270 [Candidatus Levybacteria bacterium]|nr:hypothetical protein [Candidatus Levybacteria bacterium]MBI3069918.1 hypothetical protein [Candidatus Levybacteria bacterium]MBI3093097.1 hypothetical protein [Candidatus Levybacteria bacterium]
MNQSERLGKPGEQRNRGSRLELWYALYQVLIVDLVVGRLVEAIERRIGMVEEGLKKEITAATLPDD